MITTILFFFIVAIALPSFQKNFSPILFSRFSSIVFIYAGLLWFNGLYIESIVSGVSIYSELLHVTEFSQMLNMFLLFLASLILIIWPSICFTTKTIEVKTINKKRKNKNSNIRNFSTSTLKQNTVKKPNNLPHHNKKIGAYHQVHILNNYYLIIMFSILFSISIIFFYDSVYPTLSIVVQFVISIMISFIVSYLITSFLIDRLRFSDDFPTAYLQKVLFTSLILILICYIIYKYNIIDTIFSSSDELVTDKLTDTNKNPSSGINTSIALSEKSVEKIVESSSSLLKEAIIPFANQLGISAAMGGLAGAAATVLKGTPMRPSAKIASIIFSGVAGGASHLGTTTLQRRIIRNEQLKYNSESSSSQSNLSSNQLESSSQSNLSSSQSNLSSSQSNLSSNQSNLSSNQSNLSSNQSNLSSNQLESSTSNQISNSNPIKPEDFVIPSPNETFTTAKNNLYNFIDNHPVDVLLYSILVLNFVSLFLMFSLSISLLYKLFTKSTLELKFLDKIMSENNSTTVKYYINKILQNSSRLNTLHIIFMILVIIFSNIMAIYLLSAYIYNLELISKIYLGLIK